MKKTKEAIIKNYIVMVGAFVIISILSLVNITITRAADIDISNTSLTINKNAAKKLRIKNLPNANIKINWSTSNKYAVTVSKKGKVKAINYGIATIRAVCMKKTFTCVITVPDTTRKVSLNTNEVTLTENTEYQLVATSVKKTKFQSSNGAVATVNSKGIIKAINPGTATITAKSARGYDTCTVTVASTDTTVISSKWIQDRNVAAIRRVTKNNNFVYDDITWAKGKDITLKIANLDENTVKKCVWSVSDSSVLSKPTVDSDCKIRVSAKTLKQGIATVTAAVTDNSGNQRTYVSNVYVSNPYINASNLTLLGAAAGSNRQQFISISGLSRYSKIVWANSGYYNATLSEYKTKVAVWGLQPGNGTITATVDGKTYKINYIVRNPIFGDMSRVIAQGKGTRIAITGIDGIVPYYTVRNSSIAKVDSNGFVTGLKSGVTYVDVRLGSMYFSYRIEVAAKGIKKIINRANYIVNNWVYSQSKRMKSGYYDCSALVWKGYKAYKKYNKKLGSSKRALSAGNLFDYLYAKKQIVYFGYTSMDDLKPGDLIFYGNYENAVKYSTPGRTLDIYHVSMYAGGNIVEKGGQRINNSQMIHIVGVGRVVK